MTAESSLPFDLTILRSFRVLRPLKLVSKVPSKTHLDQPTTYTKQATSQIFFINHLLSHVPYILYSMDPPPLCDLVLLLIFFFSSFVKSCSLCDTLAPLSCIIFSPTIAILLYQLIIIQIHIRCSLWCDNTVVIIILYIFPDVVSCVVWSQPIAHFQTHYETSIQLLSFSQSGYGDKLVTCGRKLTKFPLLYLPPLYVLSCCQNTVLYIPSKRTSSLSYFVHCTLIGVKIISISSQIF